MQDTHLPCHIIGVLENGLSGLQPHVLTRLQQADVVLGVQRLLNHIEPALAPHARCYPLDGQLAQIKPLITQALQAKQKIVVLASGDPLCHGIATLVLENFAKQCCIWPNLSSLQLACARLKRPWQGVKLVSVHGQDSGEWHHLAGPEHALYPILSAITQNNEVALLTHPANSPDRIARMLLHKGLGKVLTMAVAERLLWPDERIIDARSLDEIASMRFQTPNIVLLQHTQTRPQPVLLGLDTKYYHHTQKAPITACDVRAIALARMQLHRQSLVWDIGAGSGSVGLEAARLCADGYVFAIEKNTHYCTQIRHTAQELKIYNYTLCNAHAPAGLAHWPDPDAVFIGGSDGQLKVLIETVYKRLRPGGWLVLTLVTLENLQRALQTFDALQIPWDMTQIQTAKTQPILAMHRLQAQNPVWIICAQNPHNEAKG